MRTYLVLCPRKLALELSLPVEERPVFSAQRREALGDLSGQLDSILVRLVGHVGDG